jgi:fatty acid desaturase
MAEAKRLCQDLFEPRPLVYWSDFLFFDLAGWVLFAFAVAAEPFSLAQVGFLLGAGVCLYRAVIFVHELTHLRKGTFQAFHIAWNFLCGFPLMVPSYLYMGVHIDHHKQRLYGTKDDHEYSAFALKRPWHIAWFLFSMTLAPALFLLRFLVLTPLSYIVQPLRKPLWEMASSLAVGGGYKRPLPDEREKRIWWAQEFATFAYAGTGVGLMAAGALPGRVLALWYLVAVFILFTNGLRTLAAHAYRNPPDHEMSFSEQFLDSIDIPGNPVMTPLWAPVGLRYHATHHLFPGMPYHHLGEAHRRLLMGLPPGNPYPKALRRGLWDALARLWESARASKT